MFKVYDNSPISAFRFLLRYFMLNRDQTTHVTSAMQIITEDGEGWEFQCQDCNFRMRYFIPECSEEARLEVYSLGNDDARHYSDIEALEKCNHLLWKEWLTPEIRQTIESIFSKYQDW